MFDCYWLHVKLLLVFFCSNNRLRTVNTFTTAANRNISYISPGGHKGELFQQSSDEGISYKKCKYLLFIFGKKSC